jgi:hypothetical protein
MADRLFPLRDAAHAVARRAQAEPPPRSVSAQPATQPVVPVALLSFFTDVELVEVRELLTTQADLSRETSDLIARSQRVRERISEIVAAVRARNPKII